MRAPAIKGVLCPPVMDTFNYCIYIITNYYFLSSNNYFGEVVGKSDGSCQVVISYLLPL